MVNPNNKCTEVGKKTKLVLNIIKIKVNKAHYTPSVLTEQFGCRLQTELLKLNLL